MSEQCETRFAPAERTPISVLERQCRCAEELPLLKKILDSIPDGVMVLNGWREIVTANQVLIGMLGVKDKLLLWGRRPGEVLNCTHASNGTGGCGTTEFCRKCGAVNAILAGQQKIQNMRECSIARAGYADVFEFRVLATPFEMNGDDFTIFSLVDIVHEKRRRLLERMFFHDILNSAAGLKGYSELLKEADPDQLEEYRETIYEIADQLIEEIKAQRDLTAAEDNEYSLDVTPLSSLGILEGVFNVYRNHDVAKGRFLQIDPSAQDVTFSSDKALLRRTVGNMTKNALEASMPGDTVTLGCVVSNGVQFRVHNPGYIPRDIQLQLFKRSFSTKGKGRGLGTYSMKLLGERYLGGGVDFASSPAKGTTFFLSLPFSVHGGNPDLSTPLSAEIPGIE